MKPMTYSFSRTLLVLLMAGLLGTTAAYGQTATMAYQGYLTDTDGTPLSGTVNLSFALYSSAGGGTAIWEESQTSVPLSDGVFSVMLGGVKPLTDVNFDRPLYLGITVNGGNELAPRVRLGVAPASLYAYDIADGLAVRSLNGLTDDVTLQAGNNITLTGADGTLRIDAAAAEAFALPFEGTHDAGTVAFKITSSVAAALGATSTGGAPAIIAGNEGSGNALEIAQTGSTSEKGAIEAFSFSRGYTGLFSHFGQQGYAGIFQSTHPANTFPALLATKENLNIDVSEFSNDALVVEGDRPVIGIYGRFQQNTQPGLVLAGVDDGNVTDKWAITREFFGTQRLMFTYGLNSDHTQNNTVMTLSAQSGVSAERFTASSNLGSNGTPLPGGHYADNVVYAWAEVSSGGTLVDGFGCTVTKIGTGTYRVDYKRDLANGAVPVVTAISNGANIPMATINTTSTTDAGATVRTFRFSNGDFQLLDNPFYIQVVGRP